MVEGEKRGEAAHVLCLHVPQVELAQGVELLGHARKRQRELALRLREQVEGGTEVGEVVGLELQGTYGRQMGRLSGDYNLVVLGAEGAQALDLVVVGRLRAQRGGDALEARVRRVEQRRRPRSCGRVLGCLQLPNLGLKKGEEVIRLGERGVRRDATEEELEAGLTPLDELYRESVVLVHLVSWRQRRHNRAREGVHELPTEPREITVPAPHEKIACSEAIVVGGGVNLELWVTRMAYRQMSVEGFSARGGRVLGWLGFARTSTYAETLDSVWVSGSDTEMSSIDPVGVEVGCDSKMTTAEAQTPQKQRAAPPTEIPSRRAPHEQVTTGFG